MATIDPARTVFETENFIVNASPTPFVSRTEGGHLRIFPKDFNISNRADLTPKQAIEFMRLSIITGQALKKAMNEQGIPVVWINYEDLGNWAFKRKERPVLHLHIFGRSETATKQKWPEAVYLPDRSSGFYEGFQPLNEQDMKSIRKYIEVEFKKPEYADKKWGLK